VVSDSADVTSPGRSFHVCEPVTGKARLTTVDSRQMSWGIGLDVVQRDNSSQNVELNLAVKGRARRRNDRGL